MAKLLLLLVLPALVAVVLADQPYAPPPPPPPPVYKPVAPAYKPAPYKPEPELPPQPFAYQYGVKDDYTGAAFNKNEEQDSYGNLQGSYSVNLPDGRVQTVTYHADAENGFVADVKYEGEAQYPPEPKEGYGHSSPKYAPAPPPKYAPAPPKYVPAPPPPPTYEA